MRDTDQDWTRIAEEQPYWGILSTDEFKGADLDPATRAKFFNEGEASIAALFDEIRQANPGFAPHRALDFGCGAGRLLMPIARRAGAAVGVDVAPRMLLLAEQNLRDAGLANVALVRGDDRLSRVEGAFDFVHSHLVLQHIPPARGCGLFRRLLGLLVPGGMFAIQIAFAKRRDLMVHEAPRARYYRRDGDALHDLVPSEAELPEGTIQMYDYDLNQVFAIASEFTSQPVQVRLVSESHLSVHLVGRRTAA